MTIKILPVISKSKNELSDIFEDLHANPEIVFQEERT